MKERDFKDLTMDSETKLMSRTNFKINEIACVHEYWNWDGITGESFIFYTEDIHTISDEKIVEILSTFLSKRIEGYTLNRKEKFSFLNFNFKTN